MFNFWDFKEKPILEGVLCGCKSNVAPYHKPVFAVKIGKTDFHIWGSAQLSHKLYGIKFGTKIKITFLGKFMTEKSRYPMLHFDVLELKRPVDNSVLQDDEKEG